MSQHITPLLHGAVYPQSNQSEYLNDILLRLKCATKGTQASELDLGEVEGGHFVCCLSQHQYDCVRVHHLPVEVKTLRCNTRQQQAGGGSEMF